MWSFQLDLLDAPTINAVDEPTSTVTVTEKNGLPDGYNVRYTFGEGSTIPEDPTATSPIMDVDGFIVRTAGTLKVVIERYGVVLTEVATKHVEPTLETCANPSISYDNTTGEVTINCTDPTDAAIYYTTDGTTIPTSSTGTPYNGSVGITAETTFKAVATHTGRTPSEVVTKTISKVETPTIVNNGSNIVISCSTDGAAIYYTDDGSTPSSASTPYTPGTTVINVAGNEGKTYKAIAKKDGCITSDESEPLMVLATCHLPVISLDWKTGEVTISNGTDETIYYTTDGLDPLSGSPYNGSFTISATTTIKAVATKAGMNNSTIATETFSKVETPTIQDNGSYAISITSTTEGAKIYYATGGSTPTYGINLYGTPLNLSNVALKAKAFKEDMVPSEEASATITLQLPTPTITLGDNGTVTFSIDPEITGVTYKYTLDETDPSDSNGETSTGTFTLSAPAVVKVIAVLENYDNSAVASSSSFLVPTNVPVLLQQNESIDFFLTQVGNANKQLTTTNIPTNDIVWHFEDAKEGGVQYYNIVKNTAGGNEYLCYGTTASPKIFYLDNNSENPDKVKFSIDRVESVGVYCYNFKIKDQNLYLHKPNGNDNVSFVAANANATYNKSLWRILACPRDKESMRDYLNPLLFSTSSGSTINYYQIKTGSSYITAPTSTTDVKGATDADDVNTRWYLEEVTERADDEAVFTTYYNIRNAVTNQYMYYSGTAAGSTNAAQVKDYDDSEADKFKFVVVKSANGDGITNGVRSTGKFYNIIPKALQSEINQANNSLSLNGTNSLKTGNSRASTNTRWEFILDEDFVVAPVITYSKDDNQVTISTTTTGATIYYTTDGTTTPSASDNADSGTTSITFAHTPNNVTYKAIAIKNSHASTVTTQKIVCAPTITLGAYTAEYDGTDKVPGVSLKYGEDDILSTTYTVSYSDNKKDVGTVTITITNNEEDNNYIVYGTTTFDITPKPVTVEGITAEDKTYDGTTVATLSYDNVTISGIVVGDELTVTAVEATGAFTDVNVGTGKTVNITISSVTLGGTSKDNYVWTTEGNQSTATASITGASPTLDTPPTANTLTYNGTAQSLVTAGSATNGTVHYRVGDTGDFSSTVPQETNAGTYTVYYKVVGDANYQDITYDTPITVTINKKEIVVSDITAQNKKYDRTETATLIYKDVILTGKLEGDDLTVTATGAFADANVGTGKTVTISGLTLEGTSANNYQLAAEGQQTTATADIEAKSVTVSGITASNKTYDGTTDATLVFTGATLTGKLDGDDLTVTATGAFADANVGTGKAVTINGITLEGTSASNYQLAAEGQQTTATANIEAISVTVSGITASNKKYDGTNNATLDCSAATLTGKLDGDDLTVTATGTFENADVGAGKTVTISGWTLGGADAGNYEPAATGNQASTTADITQAPLTITAKDKSIAYGDAPANDGVEYAGFVNGETETVLSGSLEYVYNSALDGSGTAYTATSPQGAYYIIPSGLTSSNYNITFVAGTLTVGLKSIGSGYDLASGFTVSLGEGNSIILKDGETTLVEGTDYTLGTPTTSGRYTITDITGSGNYTNTVSIRFANVTFMSDGSEGATDWSATFVADGNHALPIAEDISVYIIESIDVTNNTVNLTELNYIPDGVPVLLISNANHSGFLVKNPTSYTAITDAQESANMLKKSTGQSFALRQIYLLYNNEFVLNIPGTLEAGKIYLENPNYPYSSSARLRISRAASTGISGMNDDNNTDNLDDRWFTIDGRRLNGKPTKKGLYILNDEKVVIK